MPQDCLSLHHDLWRQGLAIASNSWLLFLDLKPGRGPCSADRFRALEDRIPDSNGAMKFNHWQDNFLPLTTCSGEMARSLAVCSGS